MNLYRWSALLLAIPRGSCRGNSGGANRYGLHLELLDCEEEMRVRVSAGAGFLIGYSKIQFNGSGSWTD